MEYNGCLMAGSRKNGALYIHANKLYHDNTFLGKIKRDDVVTGGWDRGGGVVDGATHASRIFLFIAIFNLF